MGWRRSRLFQQGLQAFTVADLVAGRAFFFFDGFKAQGLKADSFAVRVIPVSQRLGRLLARLWSRAEDRLGFVFRNQRGVSWRVNSVMCRLRRLRDRLGIVPDHRGENIVAYSMRHTGATKAICAGVDLPSLSAVMGHSDIRMTARYLHLAPDHLAKSMNSVWELKPGGKRKNNRPGSTEGSADGAK